MTKRHSKKKRGEGKMNKQEAMEELKEYVIKRDSGQVENHDY